jgi:hypothetical protein
MIGDSCSVALGKRTDAFGVLRVNGCDLGAADHGGRRKAGSEKIGNHLILIPPAVIGAGDHENP